MNDSSEPSVLSLIENVASGIPEPVRKSFFKAVSDLLGGLMAVPIAKLEQYAQAINDTTQARSMVGAVLAKAAVDEASKDVDLMKVAAEIYLPTTIRKAKNRLSVAHSAAEHLETDAASDGESASQPPNDDWMNSFMRFAEDASSERLQDLFGRILAGQILHPGSFGLATLRALSELDQEIANDFSHAWAKSVGSAVDYSAEWKRGDDFSRWQRLSEFGLMAPTSAVQYLPPFKPFSNDSALWSPFAVDGTRTLVYFQAGSTSQWAYIDFTRVGRELGRLLPKPDYQENMRRAALRLPQIGVTRLELHCDGKPAEVLWRSPS